MDLKKAIQRGALIASLFVGLMPHQIANAAQTDTEIKEVLGKFCPTFLDPNAKWQPGLQEVSGIWKDPLGAENRFYFSKGLMMLVIMPLPITNILTIADDDWDHDVVTFNVLQYLPGASFKNNVWTMHRDWNRDHSKFQISLINDDTVNPVPYSFVRRFMPTDFNGSPDAPRSAFASECAKLGPTSASPPAMGQTGKDSGDDTQKQAPTTAPSTKKPIPKKSVKI